jgi:[ribosomal protein S18]-alanine N-acetyltransferase
MSPSSGAPPSAFAIDVERLTAVSDPLDVRAIDTIASACFNAGTVEANEEIGRPWARIWAARERGAMHLPVGFLVAWHVADEFHVLNIATTPSQRRRGVARELMRVAFAYAAAERIRVIILEVRRSNRPAIELYRGLGFSTLGVRARYYTDNDEDAIEMMVTLDPDTGKILPGRDEVTLDD